MVARRRQLTERFFERAGGGAAMVGQRQATMRAVLYDGYGKLERLEFREVAMPLPRSGELLVRVQHAALNPKDSFIRKGRFRLISGRQFPKRCGLDFAGTVEESRSPHFAQGQRVFGALKEWRFLRGTLAQFVVCQEDEASELPASVSTEAGAAVALVGLTALQALRDLGLVARGKRVLIHGASGGVGTAGIQLAQLLGGEVETTSSERNFELCRQLGAKRTWDYATSALRDARPRFDVVFDAFGNLKFPAVRSWLEPRGVFITTVPTARSLLREALSRFSSVQERLVVVRPNRDDLRALASWLERGALKPSIDTVLPWEQVRDAFRLLESKRTRGKIVLSVT